MIDQKIPKNANCLDTYGIISQNSKNDHIQGMIARAFASIASQQELEKSKLLIHSNTRKIVSVQRAFSYSDSMRFCHITPIQKISPHVTSETCPITLNISEHGIRFGGLASCDNPYCVFCANKRSGARGERIQQGLSGSSGRGESYFLTFTIPRQDDLLLARNQLKKRWGKLQNKIQYHFRKKLGLKVSFAKSLDVTFNLSQHKKTYHLHYHVVMIASGVGHGERVQELIRTWIKDLGSKIEIVASEKGQWIEQIITGGARAKIAKYVSKMAGLGRELSYNTTKKARGEDSLGLIDLMLLCASKDPAAIETYRDFLLKMAGARTMDFSRNWDDWVVEEEEDEESESIDETIIISLKEWREIGARRWLEIAHKLYRKMVLENEPNEINNLYEILDEIRESPWLATGDIRASVDAWLYLYDLD